MKRLNFKSIKTKMLFGFSIVILLVVIFGVYNYFVIKKSNEEARNIVEKELPLLIANEEMARTMSNRASTARGYVLYGGDYKERFNNHTEEGKQIEETVRKIGASEEFSKLVDRTVEWRKQVTEQVFNEVEKGNKELATRNLEKLTPEMREIMDGYNGLAVKSQNSINEIEQTIAANGEKSLFVATVITILIIVFSVASALITSKVITTPLVQVMERMKLIANGDLSNEPLTTKSHDEVGQLVAATNEMGSNIRELLSEINIVSGSITSQSEELTQSADEVNAGSQQIATTMQELATGTESQAASASDLATIMGSFSIVVQEANENGERIEQASNEVLQMTGEGSQLMESSYKQMVKIDQIVQDAVKKVQGLDVKSQEISNLVSVIQAIANQTNLLALNAAIEAARAGEHGKGFAVVADEVRKLAEQVSASVSDITDIVAGIQEESSIVTESLQDGYKEVTQGTAQIEITQETFADISSAVSEMANSIKIVSDNLSNIASDSDTMNRSISEIAAISEESAAGVEQTSASSQQISSSMEEVANNSDELAKLAGKLNGFVHQFKL
ncbi:HAMP domain-containing protein [Bacillus sp. FJAT-29790]|uniref:HAMP domain-containing methyl-accepting chemotaxis protein n=1 Tax=Bacillus sp. FJAT-29790 TaxID=1895002 RepID=UPI001C242B65|nr:methyl-accepting chemotaxis protein [Bacillus sp. FJAT-29790]MBU8881357.1 HAMP domain-containing protein [Bacillus sp. FJAT-29790]